jgi:superfamily II DNA or RNA helicase
MRSQIQVQNALSTLVAPRPVIDQIRELVSYREKVLPPRPVQMCLKSYMMENGRSGHGWETDLDWAYRVPYVRDRMIELGWPIQRWTRRIFEDTLAQAGTWDGWTTAVSTGGTFGTGLLEHVIRALTLRLGQPYPDVIDLRGPAPRPNPLPVEIPVRDYQLEAVESWFRAECRGVIDSPPRTGKTRMAAKAIASLGLPTLMIVPRINLVSQTVEEFRRWFDRWGVIGLTGGTPTARKAAAMSGALIWVATPGTAAGPKVEKGQPRPGIAGIKSRKLLVIDEFHHAASDTYQDISIAASEAYCRLGLTGTHFRADGKDLMMHAVLQRAVFSRSVPWFVERNHLVPARVAMVRISGEYGDSVVDHPHRNALLTWCARELMQRGKRVLVLAKEVQHTRDLAAQIPGAMQVDGEDNSRVKPALDDLAAGRLRCVVGTSVIGEGVDVPAADAIVLAGGGRSKVTHMQSFFRVLTAAGTKSHGVVIDFADNTSERLIVHAANRLAHYRDAGFVAEVMDPATLPSWFDANA